MKATKYNHLVKKELRNVERFYQLRRAGAFPHFDGKKKLIRKYKRYLRIDRELGLGA